MNYQMSHSDVEAYQTCPLLYRRFKYKQEKTQTETTIIKCVQRILLTEMEIEQQPDYRRLTTHWGKLLQALKLAGMPIKQVNNILLNLKAFYDVYAEKIYKAGLRAVAVNLPVEYMCDPMIYTSLIPVVFTTEKLEIIPLFFNIEYPRHSNLVRFASVCLEDKLSTPVERYLVIDTPQTGFRLSEYTFRDDELKRAERELRDILFLAKTRYATPNTINCSKCPMISKCKL